jgi:hypothetical protein
MNRTIILSMVIALSACTHQTITWERTGEAAQHAAMHPAVWGPLLGAGVFAIGDLDSRTSDYLSDHAPIFGDSESAGNASTDINSLLSLTAGASAFVAPVPPGDDALLHRGEHLAVVVGGLALTGSVTDAIKSATNRPRPNNSDDKSFPSGHASQAFASATFASANFHRAWGDSSGAKWADAGLYTAASLTALARVEAQVHYPSDVMAGAALGNFMARFLDELLLTDPDTTSLSAFAGRHTVIVEVRHAF